MTTGKHSQSSEKRIAFLGRVEHYVNKRPMWTPAEGALLVNGVMLPVEGCADIPDDLAQLEDPVQPATQSQLLGARLLLREYRRDVENGDASQAERITSDEFLKWCKDGDFLPTWTLKLAEFLRHLYFPGDANNQFPLTVEDELATLRMAMAAKALQIPPAAHAVSAAQPAAGAVRQRLPGEVGSVEAARTGPSMPDELAGVKKRERQMRAIEAGADALNFDRRKILDGGKKQIFEWCLNNSDLFGASDYRRNNPFRDAWNDANKAGRVAMANRDRYRRR
jgi:hypothetical protein